MATGPTDFEGWLRAVSAECVSLPAEEVHTKIESILQHVLEFFGVDRCTLFLLSGEGAHVRSTHSVAAKGAEPVEHILLVREIPRLSEAVLRGEVFQFSRVEDLPENAAREVQFFSSNKIKSHIDVPLLVGGSMVGVLSASMIRSRRIWSDKLVRRFRLVAETLGSLLVRWRDNERIESLLGFESMISEISHSFVEVAPGQVDESIEHWLERIGIFLGADRCNLIQIGEQEGIFHLTHAWAREGFEIEDKRFSHAISKNFPWGFGEISQGRRIQFTRVSELPDEAISDKEAFTEHGVKSHLSVPLKVGEKVLGVLAIGACRIHRDWPEEIVRRLQMAGDILVSNLQRARMEQELEARLNFEEVISEIGSHFVALPGSDVKTAVACSLERIRDFLKVDRIVLAQVSEDGNELVVSHSCQAEGIPPFPPAGLSARLPWYTQEILRRQVFRVERMADLPAHATLEREYAGDSGVRSNLTIPVEVEGAPLVAISFDSFAGEKRWPEEFIPRLQLLGQIFVNAMVRRRQEQEIKNAYREINRLKDQLAQDYTYLKEEIKLEHGFEEMIGKSSAMQYVRYKIEESASTDCTVVLLGETGTGKELVARAIHDRSTRSKRPLVKVNCAALPANLIESELFGHERGAFSGAEVRRLGRFESAAGTTLFLDEIGELPIEMQAKLLRVLEHGEFERLGSSATVKVDVRVISASNRDLEREVQEGRFRSDLWYRLSVFPITVPPLRHRKEDIPFLVDWFVGKNCAKMGKTILQVPSKVIEALLEHDWPGNVRELENVVERAVITSRGPKLELPDFVASARTEEMSVQPQKTLQDLERDHIVETLRETGWRIDGPKGAARILDMNPSTLRSRMKKLGVKRQYFTA